MANTENPARARAAENAGKLIAWAVEANNKVLARIIAGDSALLARPWRDVVAGMVQQSEREHAGAKA